mmetsp:Transcript_79938/g.141055  ORF Transcript_79938/g.141055 Transcript_79938/m.141055 type:complete len:219 (+) Transcript_79938:693-1349(+)
MFCCGPILLLHVRKATIGVQSGFHRAYPLPVAFHLCHLALIEQPKSLGEASLGPCQVALAEELAALLLGCLHTLATRLKFELWEGVRLYLISRRQLEVLCARRGLLRRIWSLLCGDALLDTALQLQHFAGGTSGRTSQKLDICHSRLHVAQLEACQSPTVQRLGVASIQRQSLCAVFLNATPLLKLQPSEGPIGVQSRPNSCWSIQDETRLFCHPDCL